MIAKTGRFRREAGMKRMPMIATMAALASVGSTACMSPVDLKIGDLFCDYGCGPPNDTRKPDTTYIPPIVATWNVYMGAELEPLFNASSEDEVPALTADYWSAVQGTDFRDRAEAIASAIAAADPADPDALMLQEVMLFRTQSPGDATSDAPTAAQDTALDFLAILRDALTSRGLDYRVVVESDNFDIEVPMAVDGGLDDLRITDRDVILARGDREVAEANFDPFSVNRTVQVGQASFVLSRGWAYADLIMSTKDNRQWTVRLATTQLESEAFPDVQEAQAEEFLSRVQSSYPIVIAGDLESPADSFNTIGLQVLRGAGADAWTTYDGSGSPGFTCCHAPTLDDDRPLSRRVDYIFAAPGQPTESSLRFSWVQIFGADSAGHTAAGRWPSTHAGLFASVWFWGIP
jgi:hypothetical protein